MSDYSENASNEKISETQQKISEVAVVIRENIDLALQNTENLEMIESKSEQLELESNRFRKLTGKLRCRMCRDNIKPIIIIILIIIIIVLIIIAKTQ